MVAVPSHYQGRRAPRCPKEAFMRFCQPHTRFFCGIDLHARSMYICIVDRQGKKRLHCGLRCDRRRFLRLVAPYQLIGHYD